MLFRNTIDNKICTVVLFCLWQIVNTQQIKVKNNMNSELKES
jgi:hypothetical protein